MGLKDDWNDIRPKTKKKEAAEEDPLEPLTPDETDFWERYVIAFVQGGHDMTKGAHLKSADRAVRARRKRLQKPTRAIIVTSLADELRTSLGVSEGLSRVEQAEKMDKVELDIIFVMDLIRSGRQKIQAIKALREETRIGLKEAKEVYERVEQRMIDEGMHRRDG